MLMEMESTVDSSDSESTETIETESEEDDDEEEVEEEEDDEEEEDEEEDEKEPTIQLSCFQSFLSVIPGTIYWYEARRAAEYANNLRRMRKEVERSQKLVELCENGQHTDVLVEHGKDTDLTNFFYFNEIKGKLVNQGKWKWKPPSKYVHLRKIEDGPEATKHEATGMLRRIQRDFKLGKDLRNQAQHPLHLMNNPAVVITAFNALCDAADDPNGNKSTTFTHKKVLGVAAKKKLQELERKRKQCAWSYRADDGQLYRCRNLRFEHPKRKVTDEYGVIKNDLLLHCSYHTEICVGTHDTRVQPVTTPNEAALCNHCYLCAKHRAPPKLTALAAPGVYADMTEANSNSQNEKTNALEALRDLISKQAMERRKQPLTESTICTWIPDRQVPRERGYTCKNLIIRNPNTQELIPFCGWHAPSCLLPHPSHNNKKTKKAILVPNCDGLCLTHFAAQHGRPPIDIGWPLPGMVKLDALPRTKKMMRKIANFHPLAPSTAIPALTTSASNEVAPPMNAMSSRRRRRSSFAAVVPVQAKKDIVFTSAFQSKKKSKLKIPASLIQLKMRLYWRLALYLYVDKALMIQCAYRRHLAYHELRRRSIVYEARRRTAAMEILQATARSYLACIHVKEDTKAKFMATIVIQRYVRAMLARMWIRDRRIAIRLQLACVKLYRRMIQSSILEFLKTRKEKMTKNRAERMIYRIALGAIGRLRAARRRDDRTVQIMHQVKLAAIIRGSLFRKRAGIVIEANGKRPRLKIFFAIAKLQAMARKQDIVKKHAPIFDMRKVAYACIQRYARGFLCRCRARHARELVEYYWNHLVGPLSPQRRQRFEQLLPKARYPLYKNGSQIQEEIHDNSTDVSDDVSLLPVFNDTWFQASDATFFEKYDDVSAGTVTRFEFRATLREIWQAKGLTIQVSELEPLVKLFDSFSDGHVDWREWLNYARLNYRPCSLHRRICCGVCVARGPCQRKGCVCDVFTKHSKRVNDLVCKNCGHTPESHMLVPKCCVDDIAHPQTTAEVTHNTLVDIFSRRSMVPEKPPQELIDNNIPSANKKAPQLQTAVEASSSPKEPSPTVLHRPRKSIVNADRKSTKELCLPRPKKSPASIPNVRDGEIPSHELVALRLATPTVSEPNATIRESIQMAQNEFETREAEFANAKQTKDELERGFGISRPVPVVADDELRLTTRVGDLYLKLVEELGDERVFGARRLDQDPRFVTLVFEHDVFLERHWKKIVRDIRSGRLNRHLPISGNRRDKEAKMYPKPNQATRVDRALHALGFHARSSGVHGSLAAKVAGGDATSKNVSKNANQQLEVQTDDYIEQSLLGATQKSERTPNNGERKKGCQVSFSQADILPTNTALTPQANLQGAIELLKLSKDDTMHPKLLKQGAVSRRGRRSTTNDITGDALDVHRISYHMKTLPRSTPEEPAVQSRRTLRFVCPQPGCGKCFSSRDTCLEHYQVLHSEIKRLAIATPDQDQYLNNYWPANVPWQKAEKQANFFPFKCPICSIKFKCRSRYDLRRHLVTIHPSSQLKDLLHELKGQALNDLTHDQQAQGMLPAEVAPTISEEESAAENDQTSVGSVSSRRCNSIAILRPGVTQQKTRTVFTGSVHARIAAHVEAHNKFKPVPVPPFPPPTHAPSPICTKHERRSFRCRACTEAKHKGGPTPPIKFFEDVIVSTENIIQNEITPIDQKFVVQSERGPTIFDYRTNTERHAQLVAVCLDATGKVWIGVSLFWSFQDIYGQRRNSVQLPADFDRHNELIEDATVYYMSAERICGHCFTLNCDKNEFINRGKATGDEALPTHPKNYVKFSRFVYDTQNQRLAPRVLDHTAPPPDVVLRTDIDTTPPQMVCLGGDALKRCSGVVRVHSSPTGSFRNIQSTSDSFLRMSTTSSTRGDWKRRSLTSAAFPEEEEDDEDAPPEYKKKGAYLPRKGSSSRNKEAGLSSSSSRFSPSSDVKARGHLKELGVI